VPPGAGTIPAQNKQGNDMTNDILELSIDELETVSGGSWISTAYEYAKTCVEAARCMADVAKDAY
jgi:hypothetical protein